ncbi:MAG: IS701 family transposase [Chloroflexota bacterium]
MPTEIVTETCPAPECNLTEQDIEQFLDEMTHYIDLFEPAFQRVEQLKWSKVYLRGLLGDASRKNIERIAHELGEKVRSLQPFIGQSPWKAEPVIEIHQRLVAETLGEADGVALIDESGMVKQGDDSVGVAVQYCGSVGKVANSQVGVYLGYASRKWYSLIEGQLFMPEAWFDDEHTAKCEACGVPADPIPQTKPEIGLELLRRAFQRGSLPFQWVAADELYGDSPAFRDGVAELNKWYFTEIKCTTLIWRYCPEVHVPEWKGRGRRPTRLRLRNPADRPINVQELVTTIPKDGWTTATIKEGSKGPIICDFAFLRIIESRNNLPGPQVWLIIRRNLDDLTEIKFYFSNALTTTPLSEFVRLNGMCWPIETIFEEAKGEIGFDHYEMRSWLGWHHHDPASINVDEWKDREDEGILYVPKAGEILYRLKR